jgi:hypothetical protein
MARFCTSCGSPVEEAQNFCPKCGSHLGARSAPATATKAKAGSPILKIVLAALFALITVAGMATYIYIGNQAKQRSPAGTETAKIMSQTSGRPDRRIEKGDAGSEAATAAARDVPHYSGAIKTESGRAFSFGGLRGISGQEFVTDDSLDNVVGFYKENLGTKIPIHEAEGSATFEVATERGLTTASIRREESAGKTKITVGHIGK